MWRVLGVLLVFAVPVAAAGADLSGAWSGNLAGKRARATVDATLVQAGTTLTGAFKVGDGVAAGTWDVRGRVRGRRVRLAARRPDGVRLAWDGRTDGAALRGVLRVRGAHVHARGRVVLTRTAAAGGDPGNGTTTALACGAAWFADHVMPEVVTPICAQCHVAGGLAAAARFRVTPGDPAATSASAYALVDVANPSASRLLQKPTGQLPHGGGVRLPPGRAELAPLTQWVTLVTAPGCGNPAGGGGNGGGGGGNGPDTRPVAQQLYEDTCGVCHGTDARGLAGRPNIRCNADVAPTVRSGRGAMPSFASSVLSDADLAAIQGWLDGLCGAGGADTPGDLYASNCARCHGPSADGRANTSGVQGPDIRCADAGEVRSAVRHGEDAMPAFPQLTTADVDAIVGWLAATCPAGGGGGGDD